jgi:hypothetical protein
VQTAGITQLVELLATGWMVWGVEIFSSRPDQTWGPPSLPIQWVRVFPGGKAAGAWRRPTPPPPPSSACSRVNFTLPLPLHIALVARQSPLRMSVAVPFTRTPASKTKLIGQ